MFPLADKDGTYSYIAVNFIILASVEILAPHVCPANSQGLTICK